MSLDGVPLDNVVVTATPNGGTAGDAIVTPTSRTFTTANWSSPQTFTVQYGGTPGTTNIELSAPGQTTRTMVVTTLDVGCK